MIKNKRGAIEFSFAWIFAIVAGMFILFLAIYGVTKFINLERGSINAQTAVDIGVLTNPLESSFESAKRGIITVPADTRIYTYCVEGNAKTFFGKQIIEVSQKTYNTWSENEKTNVTLQNKYVYADSPVEGRKFYVFSKQFDFPFKIADLMYVTSTKDKYCFIDSPLDIQEEIKNIRGTQESPNENLFLKTATPGSCPEGSMNVCFKTMTSSCDVKVYRNYDPPYVQKEGKTMYFKGDALMYAAIFSNKNYYECELTRLMNRTEQIYEIYKDKSNFVFQKYGCDSSLYFDLIPLVSMIKNYQSSEDLYPIYALADEINTKNEWAECKLW